ncbi:MAG: DMT family transporter [Desulfosoma sp.]|uniref:DMT family transporter n=1 Tax=Desulfosoma sp. TaxID=2603217 RepID=UPI004049C25A
MNAPFASTPIPRKGYLYVIVAAMLWAVSGSAGKYLFNHGVTPYQVVQMRVTLAAGLLFLWLVVSAPRKLRIAWRDVVYFMILGITGLAMVQFTYFYTISKIKVAAAILLEYLAPVLIALYSVTIAREKLTWPTMVAVTGATLGCYLVVGGYNLNLFHLNKVGLLSGLASAVSFAWYSVHGEHGMRRYSPWTVLFYAFFFAALFWNIAHPPLEAFRHAYAPVQWAWILYIAVLGTLMPFGLYFHGINLIRSTRASITATLEPILAGFVSYFFLGETLERLQIIGGFLVIGAVILLQVRREFDDATPELLRARQHGVS